jgi:hypothetical protein
MFLCWILARFCGENKKTAYENSFITTTEHYDTISPVFLP